MKKFTSLIAVAIVGLVFAFSLVIPAQAQPQKMVRVLIGYKNQPGDADRQRIRGFGGQTGFAFHIMPVMTATVPENELQFLRNDPDVAYVEEDVVVNALDDMVPWGISQVKADQVQPYNEGAGGGGTGTGKAVKVAIIDTGIDNNHPDLNVKGGYNFVANNTNYDDDNGHGTHVAGIIAALDNGIGIVGVAPQAELYAVKVLNSSGSGYLSTVAAGMEWAVTNHMQVINMSLGASSGSTTLQTACQDAWNAGIVTVAAAGNSGSGTNTVLYPAQYSSYVIAVAATDSSNTRASFSSTGAAVDLSAPGVSIYSTYMGGGYTTLSGTSMASPHVAGVAALVIASGITDTNGNGLMDEVRAKLRSTATPLPPGSTAGTRNNQYGYGLVDAYKAAGVDHYSVSTISSQQTVGVGFNITIHAKDYYNNDINSGSETVNITSSTGYPVTPTQTTTTNGTATVNITLNQGGSQTITFTGQTTHKSGTSNTFNVIATIDQITVTPTNPLVPANPHIVENGTLMFTAQGFASGNPITGLTYNWSCTGGTVSPTTGSSTTTFTAGSTPGDYTVQASFTVNKDTPEENTITGKATGTIVDDSALVNITVTPSSSEVVSGNTQAFTVQVDDGAAPPNPVYGLTYSWSVNNSDAGSIDSSGVFTAKKVGNYTDVVQAKTTYGAVTKTGKASVTIDLGPLDHITVTLSDSKVMVGNTLTCTAQGYDLNNNAISGLTYSWNLTNSNAGSLSIIDPSDSSKYTFTAGTKADTYTDVIQATAPSGTVTKTGKASVTVDPGPLSNIKVTPVSATVAIVINGVGGTQLFTAQGYDSNNNTINTTPPPTYTWIITDPTPTGSTIYPPTGTSTVFTAGSAAGTCTIQAYIGAVTSLPVTATVSGMHVGSATKSLVGGSSSYVTYAKATLTITNGTTPVSGASVTAHWTWGTRTSNVKGTTNNSGQITFVSMTVSRPAKGTSFILTIDNIVKSGLTYDSDLDVGKDNPNPGTGKSTYSIPVS